MPAKTLAFHLTVEAERAVRAGHPWVYAEALREDPPEAPAGMLAVLYDKRNRFLALGLYDPASPLRVRVLQRFKPASLDAAWYVQRLREATARREALLADARTTGLRLVHGENDGLPGVVVDRYDRTLVLKLYTAAWLPHVTLLLEALQAVWPAERCVLRLSRAVATQPELLSAHYDGEVLYGAPVTGPVAFLERGLRFEADVVHGHKTGFFLDQRDNRALVESLSRGQTVLDAFAYTGAFAVAAARGGAREILSVDASAPALAQAQRHLHLNRARGPDPKLRYEIVAGDVFDTLRQLSRGSRRFTFVILDPPAFAQTQAQVPGALTSYGRLVREALSVLVPEGLLFISSCSGHVRADDFFTAVHRAARAAGRPLKELHRTGHPADHPIRFPEGAYLKGVVAVAGVERVRSLKKALQKRRSARRATALPGKRGQVRHSPQGNLPSRAVDAAPQTKSV